MQNKSSIKRTGNNFLVGNGRAVVSFSALPNEATSDVGKVTKVSPPNGGEPVEVAYWGKKNDLPYYREELIAGNNIVPSLIERKRDIMCGQGWYAYQERFIDDDTGLMTRVVDEVPMTPEMIDFFSKFKKQAKRLVGEILKHGIAMPEFVRAKGGKIISIESLEMKYMRSGRQSGRGKVSHWYWSNFWYTVDSNVLPKDRVIIPVPVYDAAAKQGKFVLPLCDDLLNDGYYPMPSYWGGRHWINLSNIIPLFHEANLKHGSAPRFHIVVPHDYFWDYAAMNLHMPESPEHQAILKNAADKEAQFINDINEVLVGVGNTGRPIVTKSEIIEVLGGRYDRRIHIEEIKYEINDEALLKLYAASNVANVSAQALHPTLASIEPGSKGIGSGTEIRIAFQLYLIIAAPMVREMLGEVLELVKRENGWPGDIKFGIRDAEMTTLAENPTGMQQKDPNKAVAQ